MASPRSGVQPGQHYRQNGSPLVWRVEDMPAAGDTPPHARLCRVDDPTSVKLLSVAALREQRLYKLVGESAIR
ncbi:hypothetical protein GALL_195770 [mine drainage metagenome]|uniref:Uncharacterized protein n=1 Tax=mine drainage metagenome TaxID=410659 RepID=A0A1J5S9M6_9ZZZZ